MRIESDIPDRIEEVENVFIRLKDGCRLAARLWLPKEGGPSPAVLEYLPYRKRDFMRSRDEPMHGYFAGHGYASVRVDIRGTGDSDGIMADEYTPQEQDDALEVIAWIAAQPWCDGNVGMMGISWGGFNALQVAAKKPPALKAIMTLCSSDDRYADDAHYMGGCLLNENMQWGSILMAYTALPPDPEIVGERWREMWRARLEALEPFPATWMSHQTNDAFWRQGSVCEAWSVLDLPVYAIGGWADGYSNAVPRLMEHLPGPKKGLIGPWAHTFPHNGIPGPAIGFLQEAVRWWDTWLKGHDTGIMDEPALRIWMQESVPPAPQYELWPGRWVAEETWPSERTKWRTFHLDTGQLRDEPGDDVTLCFTSPQTTGVRSGEWCGFGADGDMPRDQRPDDGGSLVFDSDPLTETLEILGAPVVQLEVAADRPLGLVCARLCDVDPSGTVLRVSYGLLNLTHRRSRIEPEPMTEEGFVPIRIKLNDLAHSFPAGHRLRLSISTSYWPIAWPSPKPVALSVRTAASSLSLPTRQPSALDENLRPFEEPAEAPGIHHRRLRALPLRRTVEIDLSTNEMVYTLKSDGGEFAGASLAHLEPINLDMGYTIMKRYRILENDPLSAQTELRQTALLRREDWDIRIRCDTRLTATEHAFQFAADVEAFEGDTEVAHRQWTLAIPRLWV